jgi:uncharacterized protein
MSISHDPESRTFTLPTDSGTAYLEYSEPSEGTLDLLHTVVPPADQNRGIGSELVEHVFRHARAEQIQLVLSCPFVRSWLDENPGYRDVVR